MTYVINNLLSSQKERFDKEVINSVLQKISENVANEIKIHFVYAGYYYSHHDYENRLKSIILNGMKKRKIKSVMVTSIHSRRWELITKEKMESFCKGKEDLKESVNDDIESLFENIQLEKEPDETVETYFLPMLTDEELELVERKDKRFLRTFYSPNPDVDKSEMRLSESHRKYVKALSWRRTFGIENSSENSSKNSSENSSKNSSENSYENSYENWSEISSLYSYANSIENLYDNWSENVSLYSYISGKNTK